MVNFLVLIHSSEEILSCNAINPTYIKIEIRNRVGNHVPFILFSNMFDNSILGFYDKKQNVPVTFILMVFFLLAN